MQFFTLHAIMLTWRCKRNLTLLNSVIVNLVDETILVDESSVSTLNFLHYEKLEANSKSQGEMLWL